MRDGTWGQAIAVALAALLIGGCSDTSSGATGDTVGGGDTGVAFPDGAVGDTADDDTTAGIDTDAPPSDTGGAADTGEPPTDTGGAADTTPPSDTTAADTAGPQGPEIAVDPAQYTFSYITPLTVDPTRQVTIYNLGTTDLTITGMAWLPGSSPDFDIILLPPLPKVIAPQKSTLVSVRFRNISGGVGTLRISSNDPARPTVDVVFDSYLKSGTATPEPCGQIVPSKLDFGQVVRGNTVTKTATLTNCGTTSPLVVSSVTRSTFFFLTLSDEFQITNLPPTPITLQPGQSIPIDVAYTPLLAGLDTGYFAFNVDDPNEPQLKLDVSAVGKAPPPETLGLRVKISWNTNDTDVDSHLLAPGGTLFDCVLDCFFGNPSPDWGVIGDWLDDPFLDVDDVDGYGPENINISEPMAGTYKFVVHYYADSHQGGSQSSATTVELYSYNTLIGTFGPTTLQSTGHTWDVFTVEWPSLNVTTLGNMYQNSSSGGFCGFP
ncbi:MAG: hypothetical protein CVU56_17800 [Deltaproteobacteria bacterium HGW-Deltaproteobacteria-14]|jgi:hypothetical protein|nr:MAG: hypothetical protein CVU56_17800 [Deltaproteobacteria bacterium HGW-Deltaproteobacteria-14]